MRRVIRMASSRRPPLLTGPRRAGSLFTRVKREGGGSEFLFRFVFPILLPDFNRVRAGNAAHRSTISQRNSAYSFPGPADLVRLFELANVFQFSRPLPPDNRMEGSGKQERMKREEEMAGPGKESDGREHRSGRDQEGQH